MQNVHHLYTIMCKILPEGHHRHAHTTHSQLTKLIAQKKNQKKTNDVSIDRYM